MPIAFSYNAILFLVFTCAIRIIANINKHKFRLTNNRMIIRVFFGLIRHSEKNMIQLKMCESEVKAAVPKITDGTAARTSFQDS